MKISGIYKIQSLIHSDRYYIGSAINIHDRWTRHLWELKKGIHGNSKLQRHYNKYGKDSLQFSVLMGCAKDDLITTEQFFIDSYNPFFNTCKKAGSVLGIKRSDETKRKLSFANKGQIPYIKGKHRTPEEIQKLKDRVWTQESRQKASESAKNRKPISEVTRQRQIDSHLGKKIPPEIIAKRVATYKNNMILKKLANQN
jgi:group I intron endonuclease